MPNPTQVILSGPAGARIFGGAFAAAVLSGTVAAGDAVGSGSAAPVPAPAPAAPALSVAGVASLSLASTAGVTNAPFAIGVPLAKGQFPASSGVSVAGIGSAYQVTVRNQWDDGSVKFALIAGRASVAAATAVSAQLTRGAPPSGAALTEANFLASGITASLQFGSTTVQLMDLVGVAAVGGSGGITTGGRVQTLASGPQMSSWLYCARLSATDPNLQAWFEVRYFGGSVAHIVPWMENGWMLVTGCAGQAGTLTFALNGVTKFTDTVHCAAHCAVYAQDVAGIGHWAGTTSDLYAVVDPTYLQTTDLVQRYAADSRSQTSALNAQPQVYSPALYGQKPDSPRSAGNGTAVGGGTGGYDSAMGAAGFHAGVGPLPQWDAMFLTSRGDQRAWKTVVAQGLGAGRYPLRWRSENTLRTALTQSYANKTLPQSGEHHVYGPGANQNGAGDVLPTVAGYNNGTEVIYAEYWFSTHCPSMGYMAYLLTGHECFLQTLQGSVMAGFLRQNNNPSQRNFGAGLLLTEFETIRGVAHPLRNLAQSAAISPDGDAVQADHVTVLTNNINNYHTRYIVNPCASFGVPQPYANFYTTTPINRYRINAWEVDYFNAAFGVILDLQPNVGSTAMGKALAYAQWGGQFVVGRLGPVGDANSFGYVGAAREFSIAVAPLASPSFNPWASNNQGPFYSTWGQAWADTFNTSNSTTTANISSFAGDPGVAGEDAKGSFPSASTNYWPAVVHSVYYALKYGTAGAQAAYARLISDPSWATFEANTLARPMASMRASNAPLPALHGIADNTFTSIPGANFSTYVNAGGGIPAVTPFYRGSGPREAVVDAYGDPAFDEAGECAYFFGGGHGDGTYNGVIEYNLRTGAWRVVGQPTPPSVYLPGYAQTTGTFYYPSGVYFTMTGEPTTAPKTPPDGHVGGFFLTAAEGLNVTSDAGYIAPALAKVAYHVYAAAVVRGRKIHYFCAPSYSEFDIDNGTWAGWDVDIGAQLNALDPAIAAKPFSQGNAAIYDEVTDRFVVLLQPGDFSNMGTRNGVFVFNPVTRSVESVHQQTQSIAGALKHDGSAAAASGAVSASCSMVKAGRKVYIFNKTGNYLAPQVMNQGFIFDLDTKTYSYFLVQGNPAGTIYSATTLQETIPAWYDGAAIQRWNYEASNGAAVHTLNLTPVSGAGSAAAPFILAQTSRAVAGNPTGVQYRYRGNYCKGLMFIMPKSDQNIRALKLA